MSDFYKPHRNPGWNYGGKNWKLSRSKIDLFVDCPRCFYIDNKLGTARPPGYPFALNSAVDALLKKEFDIHRQNKTKHPLMEEFGVDAIPFDHEYMDEWRETFKGVRVSHEKTGFTISGAVDDIWVNPDTNELYVVDYKSTSKDEEIKELDKSWHDGYKRQMEVYQWLLRQSGFNVSNTGYFVYANGRKDVDAFDNKLEFYLNIIPYVGNDDWVEGTLIDIKKTLDSEEIPKAGEGCDYCRFKDSVIKVVSDHEEKKRTEKKSSPDTLF